MTTPKAVDRYYLTYILYYGLGILTVLPQHFFTTATDYWMYKFRNVSDPNYNSDNRTQLQAQFTSNFSTVSTVTSAAFMIITVFVAMKVQPITRIIYALLAGLLIFALTVVFAKIDTDSWQVGFYAFTLTTGAVLNGACSVFMVSIFQVVAKFPPEYLAALLAGQSLCGLFSALVQIISLSIGASPSTSGLVYFLVGMCFSIFTVVYFVLIYKKSSFFREHKEKGTEVDVKKPKLSKDLVFAIANKLKIYLIGMLLAVGATIMVQPGVTSLVISVDKGKGNQWNDVYFVPVCTFLFYNLFDYLGKEAARKIGKPSNDIILLIMSLTRIAFIPLFIFCNAQPRHHLPVTFNNDYVYIILIIAFALTNGYMINLLVIQILSSISEHEKMIATILVVVIMIVGVGPLSFLSPVIVKVL